MYEYQASVLRVIDGDTIDVEVDLGMHVFTKTRLRLLGINAPEKNTAAGKDALRYLAGVLPVGSLVVIRTEKDKTEKYGRWLATVLAGLDDVNEMMVETGHAVHYDGGAR